MAGPADKFFDLGQDPRDDRIDARSRRMKSIALVEPSLACNAVQEEGIKQEVITASQLRIEGFEITSVVIAEVGRRPHPHEQHGHASRRQATHNLFESLARELGI